MGLVITHAHEDHIGAVAWLWPQLRCPVYATPFAAAVLRRKLGEVGLVNQVKVHVIPPGGSFELGPFKLTFIRLAHSIPEAQALAIETPYGMYRHTGDWKLDPMPPIGPPTDEQALAALGQKGVLAMVCDFDQRHGGRPFRQRGRCPPEPDRAGARTAPRPHRGDLLRQQCRPHGDDRHRRARCRRSTAIVGRSLRNIDAAARTEHSRPCHPSWARTMSTTSPMRGC